MSIVIVLFAISVIVCLGILCNSLFGTPKKSLIGKHVLITGGSSGIGLSVAHEALLRGAKATLVARDESKLKAAKEQLTSLRDTCDQPLKYQVQTFSVDVGGKTSSLREMVEEAESTFGPIYMLVNCAGFAKAAKFEDVSEAACRSMMDVNFLGSFFLTQEVVRRMKSADVGGIIVFVSSAGGLFGVFGYTAYAAAKGALVKFAEALHMELKPYDISVTVNYPPDTDTPGFAEENKTKPVETGLISESAGLFKTEDVAKALIEDSLHGKFSSSVGLEGFMLATMCAGMSPVTDLFSVVSQIFLSGVFRFVSLFYLWNFARIVSAERQKRLLSKKEE